MNHDAEQLAANYLTSMRPRARHRFEAHLLACESCWQEVILARRGRQLAETARDVAPAQLREDIRAAVAAAQPTASPRSVWRGVAAAAMILTVLAGTAALVRPWSHSRPAAASAAPPPVIAAAVTSYRDGQLPGTAVPADSAPDLSALHLRLAAAATGQLHGVAVTMFAYIAPSGARLIILRSSQPFPEATEARELGRTEGAWTLRSSGVTIICARHTHAMLLLGSDAALVRWAGALLNAI